MLFAEELQELQQQQQAPTPLQAALAGLPQLSALNLSGYHLPPDPFSPLPGLTSLGVTQLFMGGRISLPAVRSHAPTPPRPHAPTPPPCKPAGPAPPQRCRRSSALARPPAPAP
jgi:hypothetical protein